MALENSKYVNNDLSSRILLLSTALDSKYAELDRLRMENYNMMVGSMQIRKADKDKLDKQGRTSYSYPIITAPIKTLTGMEREDRRSIRVFGRTAQDDQLKDIMNDTMDWMADKSDSDFQISQAYLDALIGKFGFILQQWCFDKDPLGLESCKRVNPFGIRFDMDTTDVMMNDCKYFFHSIWMSIDDIIPMYTRGKFELAEILMEESKQYLEENKPIRKNYLTTIWERLRTAAGYFSGGEYREAYNRMLTNDNSVVFDAERALFRVITAHERRTRRRFLHTDYTTQQTLDITSLIADNSQGGYDRDKLAQFKNSMPGALHEDYVKEIYITTTIPAFPGLVVQDMPYPIQNGNFMYTPIFAYNFHADMSLTQSVVDELKDVQHNFNKFKNIMLELVTKQASLGYIGKADAIKGFETEWQNPKMFGIKRVAANTEIGKDITPEQLPQIPNSIFSVEAQEIGLVDQISGVSPAAKGFKESSNESGRVAQLRADRSDLSTSVLRDNLMKARLMIGQNRLAMIQKYMTQERTLRLTTDSGDEKFIEINKRIADQIQNDITIGKYDLKIAEEPSSKTARELEYLKLRDMVDFLVQVNPPEVIQQLCPIIVKASGIGYSQEINEILQGYLDKMNQAPNPAIEQAQAEEIAQKIREIDLNNDSKELDNVVKVAQLTNMQLVVPEGTDPNANYKP